MHPESTARRLVFVRYLLRLAAAQVTQLEPLAAVGLLMQHDAIELFLQLSRETLNVGEAREFKDYFRLIDEALTGGRLPYRDALLRLNKARVGFKHHGTQPSLQDLAGFQQLAESFLAEATPLVFGVPLTSISLALLVADEATRKCLERADELIPDNAQEAAKAISEAFARLRHAHGIGPRYTGRHRREMHSLAGRLERQDRSADFRGLTALGETVDSLVDEVLLLRSGLNPSMIAVFTRLMPHAMLTMAGTARFQWGATTDVSQDACRFCYDFVVESALTLQGNAAIAQRFQVPAYALQFNHA